MKSGMKLSYLHTNGNKNERNLYNQAGNRHALGGTTEKYTIGSCGFHLVPTTPDYKYILTTRTPEVCIA